ncbi:GNAT family N-acetyltransferase [Franconibacter helveticus 513]|uniref:GNAT family N-acetyltransferase n=1 Tax=Franconibacter helveticus TaxID=357240 RepID=UPI0004651F09|nr:GNAT family N-acetyltransferase [Franconibacter helveticus]
MIIHSQRLLFRPVTEADTDALFRIYGDPATNAFNPAGPHPSRAHSASVMARWLNHWHEKGFGDWAIAAVGSPEHILGFGGLNVIHSGGQWMNNLGYRFETDAWGKGYATEFARHAVRYGFETLNLSEISARVRQHHLASQNVLLKAGLAHTGTIDDVAGAPPSLLFCLNAADWRQRQILR